MPDPIRQTKSIRHPILRDVYQCCYENGVLISAHVVYDGMSNHRPTPVDLADLDPYTSDLLNGDSGYVEQTNTRQDEEDLDPTEKF